MSTYTEPRRPLEFLAWEAHHQLSREEGTLAASQGDLLPGTVLAKRTTDGQLVPYDNGISTAGENVAHSILAYHAPNVAETQKVVVIERMAVVDAPLLIWGLNDDNGILAGAVDLLAKNIRIVGTHPAGASGGS